MQIRNGSGKCVTAYFDASIPQGCVRVKAVPFTLEILIKKVNTKNLREYFEGVARIETAYYKL
jgi:hypothetical protein